MIHRHYTAHSLNVVVNDPSVYDWVRGAIEGKLDVSVLVQNEDNVLLMGEHGGILFLKHQPGVYEAHTQVLPAGRGKWAINMVEEALEWMFTHTDAVEIITRVPTNNTSALALTKAITRRIGGGIEFHLDKGWIYKGEIVSADLYALRIQDWMAKAKGLEEEGQRFHKTLEEEYDRMGYSEPIHDDDALHDRYVGAAAKMILGGQPHKAMVFYNRWAGIAGYSPIRIASTDPLVIDIQESLLAVRDNTFWCIRIK